MQKRVVMFQHEETLPFSFVIAIRVAFDEVDDVGTTQALTSSESINHL